MQKIHVMVNSATGLSQAKVSLPCPPWEQPVSKAKTPVVAKKVTVDDVAAFLKVGATYAEIARKLGVKPYGNDPVVRALRKLESDGQVVRHRKHPLDPYIWSLKK